MWRHLPEPAGTVRLRMTPADTLSFTARWELADVDGEAVSPGTYRLRGVVGILTGAAAAPPEAAQAVLESWFGALHDVPAVTMDLPPTPRPWEVEDAALVSALNEEVGHLGVTIHPSRALTG